MTRCARDSDLPYRDPCLPSAPRRSVRGRTVMAQGVQASVCASRSSKPRRMIPEVRSGRLLATAARMWAGSGRKPRMSLTTQNRAASGSVELPALPDVCRPEGLNVRGRVQHGEIRAQMGHVEVGRSPRCLRPVDQSRDGVVLPQDVAEVEVTVQQAVRRRRRAGGPQVNCLLPQTGPPSPARNLRLGRPTEREGRWLMLAGTGCRCTATARRARAVIAAGSSRSSRTRPGRQVIRLAGPPAVAPSTSLATSRGTGSAELASSRHAEPPAGHAPGRSRPRLPDLTTGAPASRRRPGTPATSCW